MPPSSHEHGASHRKESELMGSILAAHTLTRFAMRQTPIPGLLTNLWPLDWAWLCCTGSAPHLCRSPCPDCILRCRKSRR
jgi:hypothetical protein